MNMKRYAPLLLLLLLALPLWANTDSCRFVKIEAQRLADLTMPRAGHAILRLGDEVVAFGGHTTGFVPTPTAEYLKDGKWHLMDMAYTHDNSLCVPLRSGKVLLAGGSEKPLGIGQTFSVEMYDPASHSFRGFGCLEQKRALATGVELDSGRVVITGNWYEEDMIEMFDGEKFFAPVSKPTSQRSYPLVFRTSGDNALIFSRKDTCNHLLDTIWVDRLHGPAFRPALFDEWRPTIFLDNYSSDVCFIGDESRAQYAYLFPVQHYEAGASVEKQQEARVAIALVRDTLFSLLPTACPVPMEGPFGSIFYYGSVVADRHAGRAYMTGCDAVRRRGEPSRLYILHIDYGKADKSGGAPLTLYYTDPLPEVGGVQPLLMADGNLMMVGGGLDDNFAPYRAVYLLPLAGRAVEATGSRWCYLSIASALAVLLLAALWFVIRRRRREHPQNPEEEDETLAPNDSNSTEHLMQRIVSLMETQRLYLRPDLKLSDVAALLGVNSRYISNCINSARGCSFSQFVNGYRVERAKQLIRQQPEKKTTMLYMEVGFANETSFFRTFKSLTGMTPSEWRQQLPS